MHTSISLLQPLLCFCSSPLWRHLYYGGIIFIVYPFSTLCDTCSGSTAWDGPPPGKKRERKRGYRGLIKGRARCHHVLYLDPDLVGSAVEEAPTGPTRIYYYLSGHFHYEMEEQQRKMVFHQKVCYIWSVDVVNKNWL